MCVRGFIRPLTTGVIDPIGSYFSYTYLALPLDHLGTRSEPHDPVT